MRVSWAGLCSGRVLVTGEATSPRTSQRTPHLSLSQPVIACVLLLCYICAITGSAQNPRHPHAPLHPAGGANGIGRAIVDGFLRQGYSVAYADVVPRDSGAALGFAVSRPQPGPPTEAELARLSYVQCDAGEPGQVEHAVAEAAAQLGGGVDVLVNNVGVHAEAGVPCHEASVAAWDKVLAVNLRSYFLFSKCVERNGYRLRLGAGLRGAF